MNSIQSPMFKNNTYKSAQNFTSEREDYELRRDIERNKRDMERLTRDKDAPEVAKKVAKGTVVLASAILGGMTMKIGLETSFKAFNKMLESPSVKKIRSNFSNLFKVFKEESSEIIKSLKKSASKKIDKFKETPFAKKVDKDFGISKTVEKINKNKYYKSFKTEVVEFKKAYKEKKLDWQKIKQGFINVTAGASAVATGATGAAQTDKARAQDDYEEYAGEYGREFRDIEFDDEDI